MADTDQIVPLSELLQAASSGVNVEDAGIEESEMLDVPQEVVVFDGVND